MATSGSALRTWCNQAGLMQLALDQCVFHGPEDAALKSLLKNLPSLQHLAIKSPVLRREARIPVADFSGLKSLTSLELKVGDLRASLPEDPFPYGEEGLNPISNLTGLRSLSIEQPNYFNADLSWENLSTLTKLTSLRLHSLDERQSVQDQVFDQILDIYPDQWLPHCLPPLPHLQQLSIRHSKDRGESDKHLSMDGDYRYIRNVVEGTPQLTQLQLLKEPSSSSDGNGTHKPPSRIVDLMPMLGHVHLRRLPHFTGASLRQIELRQVTGPALHLLLTEMTHLEQLSVSRLVSAPHKDMSDLQCSLKQLSIGEMEIPARGGSVVARLPRSLPQPLQIGVLHVGSLTPAALDWAWIDWEHPPQDAAAADDDEDYGVQVFDEACVLSNDARKAAVQGVLSPKQMLAAAEADVQALVEHYKRFAGAYTKPQLRLAEFDRQIQGIRTVLGPQFASFQAVSDAMPADFKAVLGALYPLFPYCHLPPPAWSAQAAPTSQPAAGTSTKHSK